MPDPRNPLYAPENVKNEWQPPPLREVPEGYKTGKGLENTGSSCYLNSTVQALNHTPAFANWLISDMDHRIKLNCKKNSCIICKMAEILINCHNRTMPFTPDLPLTLLGNKHNLIVGRQEDAHEFLILLLTAVQESFLSRYVLSKSDSKRTTTPIHQIFGGYLKSTVTCGTCLGVSESYQYIQELNLNIQSPNCTNVRYALGSYFIDENLDEIDEKTGKTVPTYSCEKCKKKTPAIKKILPEKASNVLVLQLKRFDNSGNKLGKKINIDEYFEFGGINYKLVAMILHNGLSNRSGHYYSVALSSDPAEDNVFYEFNDKFVTKFDTENKNNIRRVISEAYVLMYTKTKVRNHEYINININP
jgi:ubiquitin carboxyl-terminal hydrolase 36/42